MQKHFIMTEDRCYDVYARSPHGAAFKARYLKPDSGHVDPTIRKFTDRELKNCIYVVSKHPTADAYIEHEFHWPTRPEALSWLLAFTILFFLPELVVFTGI